MPFKRLRELGGMGRTRYSFWLLLLPFALLIRVVYLERNWIILDEFQHVHAAYLVSLGQVPYQDFFEHHTPLFYFLIAPFIRLLGLSFDTLLRLRYISLGFFLISLSAAMVWARKLRGMSAAYLVGVLILGNFSLFKSGAILYLDVFAAAFVLVSALVLWRSRERPWRTFLSGFLLGTAVLFTQKMVVVGLGSLLYFGFLAVDDFKTASRRRGWFLDFFSYGLGGLSSFLLLVILLGPGAVDDFFQNTVLTNLAWKARRFPVRELKVLAGTDAAIYFVALTGTAVWIRRIWRRRRPLVIREDLPYLYFICLASGIFLIPVVWPEYFVTVVLFACLVAALALLDFYDWFIDKVPKSIAFAKDTRRGIALLLIGTFCFLQIVDLVGRYIIREEGPAQNIVLSLSGKAVLATLVAWAVLGGALVCFARRGKEMAVILAVALIVAFPVIEQLDFINARPNRYQRSRVDFVLDNTSENDKVFYAYDGYGVFRQHTYKYWFLHAEMQMMLSQEEKEHRIVESIEHAKAPIVVYDRWVRRLPPRFHEYIRSHYRPTEFEEIWVRKR